MKPINLHMTPKTYATLSIIGLTWGFTSCDKAQNTFLASDKEAIAQITVEAFKMFNDTNDYKAFTDKFLAEDATVLMANNEPIQGRDAITRAYVDIFGSLGKIRYDVRITEIAGDGNLAYMYGTYDFEILSNGAKDNGKYILVWKRMLGANWKVIYDIGNTSVPIRADSVKM